MTPKKDEYMRGYGDGFKDGRGNTSVSEIADDLIDAMNGLIYDHCYGEARLAAEKVLASRLRSIPSPADERSTR